MAVHMMTTEQLQRDIRNYSRAVLREHDPDLSDTDCDQINDRAMSALRDRQRRDPAAPSPDIWVLGKYLLAIAEHEQDGYYG
jgi:hypothetical protein